MNPEASALRRWRFDQVDVFSAVRLRGNPLAVVHDAGALNDDEMAALARWTHLSETSFLLPPTDPAQADYRLRIFTPGGELPFAGHPTLGSAWAWLAAGGVPRDPSGTVFQECGVGLVAVRRDGPRLAFAAPPRRRTGPLAPALRTHIERALGLAPEEVQAHQWVDNGPGWCAVLLPSAARVLAVRPDWAALDALKLGVVGPHPAGHAQAFEVRALIGTGDGGGYEDPATGSLNASLAQWLIEAGHAPEAYVAAQGAAVQRAARLHVWRDGATVWVGGDVTPVVRGEIQL
ncbi:MAG: PhzF family phenazine biosynthesis protein [Rubrivivax sp.]